MVKETKYYDTLGVSCVIWLPLNEIGQPRDVNTSTL